MGFLRFFMLCRYSDDTIRAVEMLDSEEKIDLDLIVSLIRHIVLNEDVSENHRAGRSLKTLQPFLPRRSNKVTAFNLQNLRRK